LSENYVHENCWLMYMDDYPYQSVESHLMEQVLSQLESYHCVK
jgi:hypothetical protein